MKVDLRRLYSLKSIDIDETIEVPAEYYQRTDIIRMNPVKINGRIFLNFEEEIRLEANLSGTFILPCAISLEEVSYDFKSNIDEIILENNEKEHFMLELLDILWENIVLEVPIKVVKEGVSITNTKGNGWELDLDELNIK